MCLKKYISFCKDHLKKYAESTGSNVFVHVESVKTVPSKPEETGEPIPKITKLAIGTDGGFDSDKLVCLSTFFTKNAYRIELSDFYHLVLYPHLHKMYDLSTIDNNPGFPEEIYQ